MIEIRRLREAAGILGIPIVGAIQAETMIVPQLALEKRILENETSGFEPDVNLVGRPDLVMPGVQSIVVIGLPCTLFTERSGDDEAICEVSSMAWDYDYHDLVKAKLEALARWMKAQGCGETMAFCDTGPLNDRFLAFLAGLGTYGRHQLLIHPVFGSAVVFGYLLTRECIVGSERVFREPFSECGTCRICQEVCPTGALWGDYEFTATRCISSLTQQKRPLSAEEAEWINTALYGCELCQKACPRNTMACESQKLSAGSPCQIHPFELLNMNKRAFQDKYRHYGFAWRGLKTLQRNAIVNIYNSGSVKLVDQLRRWRTEKPAPDYLIPVMDMMEKTVKFR